MKRTYPKEPRKNSPSAQVFTDRRDFLKIMVSGIIILFSTDILSAQERTRRTRAIGPETPADFNAYLHIGEDGRVNCYTGKIEMGQGVITSLAQMLADELDVPVDHVKMVMGDTDLCPWDMGTFGSMSTRYFGPPMRQAAAEARAVLIDLASEHLKVPKKYLTVKDGVISDKRNESKKVTYSELTQGRAITRHLTGKAQPKKVYELRVIGKSLRRVDAVEKVTGKAQYAGDIQLPGMVYAKILRPPAHGAKLKRVDTSAARNDPEIIVVEEEEFIAVCHKYPDVAEQALARIKAEWEMPPENLDNSSIHQHLLDVAPGTGEVVSEAGNLEQGEKLAKKIFDATYYDHYVAHAALETHTATAVLEGGKITVWPATQTPFPAKDSVAGALGMPANKVRIVVPFVGGGFGGKSFHLQAVEAARLAKLTGKPVQVMWSREEEFFNDTFRPASIIKIRSGLDSRGRVVFMRCGVYYAGPRGAELFYTIPHHRVTVYGHYSGHAGAHPFATGPWRAPGNNSNTFAKESHMDAMASAAKADPLEFRLRHIKDSRMSSTLKAAAGKFGWEAKAAPSGRGYGIACLADAGACVAAMAEVDVDRSTGAVKVKRIVCAQEMGLIVNPEGARQQIEGGLIMGLGYTLAEQVEFKGGRILTKNFDHYSLPRFSWLPKIEAVLVENPGYPAQGGGEPSIPAVGAVIANAIFDATGARLNTIPMTPARVKDALARATQA